MNKEAPRQAYGETLVEIGKEDSNIVVLGADLCGSTKTSLFEKHFPERHFNMGIAEESLITAAAGLAISGKTAFASTFAVFATARAYDHIRQSIAYTRANVKIVATHAGITVGGDGATHQITEDIALMRALPNFVVVSPVDGNETRKAIRAIAKHPGPVYVRMGRGEVPTLTKKSDPFEIGKASTLRQGKDVTLIGTGIMVSVCMNAAKELAKDGIDARVINMSTIKPIDEKAIIKAAKETGAVVTAEEHNVEMGMGSAIAMVLGEHKHVPMKRVGIPDVFGESGESDELMEKYKLTAADIIEATHDVLKRKDKLGALQKRKIKKEEASKSAVKAKPSKTKSASKPKGKSKPKK